MVLWTGGPLRHRNRLGRRRSERPALYGVASAVLMYAARPAASALGVALGGGSGNVHSAGRTGGLFDSHRKAGPRSDLWILPGISAGNRGRVRGFDRARCDG